MTPLHVLIVDDSAVVRTLVSGILSQVPGMTVAVAADPLIAQEKMRKQPPDVLVLDLHLPRMDGVTFLKEIMSTRPLPVVICSDAGESSALALSALDEGAVALVNKPRLGVAGFLHDSAELLIRTVQEAAKVQLRPRAAFVTADRKPPARPAAAAARFQGMGEPRLIAIGASTGGTEAILEVLSGLSADCPPVVMVQHMPAGFTTAFAKRLNALTRLEVHEATDGERLAPGTAVLAPGGFHLRVLRLGSSYLVELTRTDRVSGHRPSVDVLFGSVAQAAGPNGVGVLLTGMGADGAEGLLRMRKASAMTFAQSEASCVVFGMPKVAIALGAAQETIPLSGMARRISSHLRLG
jgi:two-component system chemotaxis response regulator CheB